MISFWYFSFAAFADLLTYDITQTHTNHTISTVW